MVVKHPLSWFTSTNLAVAFHEVPSPKWFDDALDALARFYVFVGVDEVESFLRRGVRFNNRCHVTFDDGHWTFAKYALPILRARRIPASLFVSPHVLRRRSNYWFQEVRLIREQVGESAIRAAVTARWPRSAGELDRYSIWSIFLSLPVAGIQEILDGLKAAHRLQFEPLNMTVAELLDAVDSGIVTVGAHTCDHPVLANESDARSRHEIQASVAELSDLINRPVRTFAYPNGTAGLDFGPRERLFLGEAGVTVAFSTDVGFFGASTDPLAIRRGGCPSLEGERPLKTAARLALLPVWDRLSQRGTEAEERRAIVSLGHERQD